MADRIVVVTGGSQNIGLAIAKGFLANGDIVISADLNAPDDPGILFHKTDVSQEASVKALMDHVESEYGRLDALINNAGICIEVAIADMTMAQWDRTMNINVKGVFLMTKYALPLMSKPECKHPAIVNISSIEGIGANPMHSVYGASKGAVASFTHNTALEYGPYGIRCNAISPGWINTPFNEKFLNAYPDRAKVDEEIKNLHPVGRLGLPEDIADMAVFLASDKSGFVTGQNIVVAGGRMAKLPLPAL